MVVVVSSYMLTPGLRVVAQLAIVVARYKPDFHAQTAAIVQRGAFHSRRAAHQSYGGPTTQSSRVGQSMQMIGPRTAHGHHRRPPLLQGKQRIFELSEFIPGYLR